MTLRRGYEEYWKGEAQEILDRILTGNFDWKNVILIPSNVKPYSQKAIDLMLGSFVVKPLLTSDYLMADLVSVLRKNKFIFEDGAIMAQREKIVLCVLLLLHHTQFYFGENPLGKCTISPSFGKLDVEAAIPFNAIDGGIAWAA